MTDTVPVVSSKIGHSEKILFSFFFLYKNSSVSMKWSVQSYQVRLSSSFVPHF